MAIALDGFETLRRIGDRRQVFAAARAEVDKAARVIVVKCLKATILDLASLRALCSAVGSEAFALIAHDMKASETLALLKRIDKHSADLKGASPAARAHHLVALASGEAVPAAPPAKAGKAASKARTPKRVESALMKAFASGGHDDDQAN